MGVVVRVIGSAVLVAALVVLVNGLLGTKKTTAATENLSQNDINLINILVRNSVITLNNANRTGNYTVLRDLGTPGFRAANNAARLSQIFSGLRRKQFDLAPVVLFQPRFSETPIIQNRQVMRTRGFFPTRPQQVNFDFTFQNVNGNWLIHAMSVDTAPANAAALVPPPRPKNSVKSSPPSNAHGLSN